jgi:hypothetical protein
MSRIKAYRACLVGFVASGLLLGVLAIHFDEAFLVAFFANIFVWSWLLRRPACSAFGTSLAPYPRGSFMEMVRSFAKATCRTCGSRLDETG